MANVIIHPASGILEFNTSADGSATLNGLTGAARIQYKNTGELNITALSQGDLGRFSIDGSGGRLFFVTDSFSGSLFSVNDKAGIPVLEVFDNDRVVAGQYNSFALGVSGVNVGIGTQSPATKLDVRGNVYGYSLQLSGQPSNMASPVNGNVWFDSTNNVLRTYGNNSFRTVGLAKTIAVFNTINHFRTATFATSGYRNNIPILQFDPTTNEGAQFIGIIPSGVNVNSGILAKIVWMATSATTGDVAWSVEYEKMNTDLDADSFATPVASGVTTTNGTAGIPAISLISSTATDGLNDGDPFRVRLTRLASSTLDTMTGDAEFILLELQAVI
jgi:hypothetical protein